MQGSEKEHTVSAHALASWLEKNAAGAYWSVDGDPLLTSQLDFPCPTEEIVGKLRWLGGQMFVRGSGEIEECVIQGSPAPGDDNGKESRTFYLRWKGQDSTKEWVLFEDVT